MSPRVTVADVAREAGVSATTVSHALSGKGRVDDATRMHVRQVAASLGYVPNRAARNLALEMYANGVGAIFTVAGGSDAGVIEAATTSGRWVLAVGPDVRAGLDDEAAARVLTSMVTRIDLAVYDAARDYLDGQFTGGDIVAGLDSGWLTWSDDGGNLDPIADQLDQVQALVVSGAIAVPSTP